MLNVKYLIDLDQDNAFSLRENQKNLGNAWFIESLVKVENNDQEILMLNELDYSKTCLSTMLENKKYEYDSKKVGDDFCFEN